jgi:hypothetical protein
MADMKKRRNLSLGFDQVMIQNQIEEENEVSPLIKGKTELNLNSVSQEIMDQKKKLGYRNTHHNFYTGNSQHIPQTTSNNGV